MTTSKELQLKLELHSALNGLVAYDRVPVVVQDCLLYNTDTRVVAQQANDAFADVEVGDYITGTGIAAKAVVASLTTDAGSSLETSINNTASSSVDITVNGGEAIEAVSVTITAPTVIIPKGTRLTFYLLGATPAYVEVIVREDCAAAATELLIEPAQAAITDAMVAKFYVTPLSFYRKIGTGDGALFTFALTIATKGSKPIVPGTVVITDGVETFTDNGDGTLTGDATGTGTIDYLTRAVSVTFAVEVVDTVVIYASFLSGDYRKAKVIPSGEGKVGRTHRHVEVIDNLTGDSFYIPIQINKLLKQ